MIGKRLALAGAITTALAAAAPAYAINDGRVPADECSSNPKAVGEPGGAAGTNPGINTADPVAPPVSDNNLGHGDGAQGNNSEAFSHCT